MKPACGCERRLRSSHLSRRLACGLVLAWLLAAGLAFMTHRAAASDSAHRGLTLLAGTMRGLYRSFDWGLSWDLLGKKEGEGLEDIGAVRSISTIGSSAFAGGDAGVFLSTDFGLTWKKRSSEGPILSILSSRYPGVDPTVFLGAATGLLRSNGGADPEATALKDAAVFQIVWPGPDLFLGTSRGLFVSYSMGQLVEPAATLPLEATRAIVLSRYYPNDPVIVVGVGQQGAFRSRDRGKTWTAAGLEGRAVLDLVWVGPEIFAVTDEGLWRSDNVGGSWTRIRANLPEGVLPLRLAFPAAPDLGSEALLCTNRGLWRSMDGGATWELAGLKGEHVLCMTPFPPFFPTKRR
jgi:photosystem II stability/assembly factor-like uncharacterized protein